MFVGRLNPNSLGARTAHRTRLKLLSLLHRTAKGASCTRYLVFSRLCALRQAQGSSYGRWLQVCPDPGPVLPVRDPARRSQLHLVNPEPFCVVYAAVLLY